MPAPNQPLIVKVALLYKRDTRNFVNTFHVYRSAGWDYAAMVGLAGLFTTWFNTYLKAALTNDTSLVQIQVRLYDPDNPLAVDVPVTPPIAGTGGTDDSPANAAAVISWRTQYAGRRYRGRDYIPSIPDPNINNDDTMNSPYVALLATAASNLLSTLVADSKALAIFHRNDNLFSPVATYIVDYLVDSMRSRLAGRGA